MKEMWAENGDVISKQYAGTSSTITSVTKTGKQGFMGKIDQMRRGVERFLVNNIEDGFKHECIKMFLNQHPQQQQYGIRASLEKQLEKYNSHFQSWNTISLHVFTWNCAGNTPSSTFDISNILLPEDISPDVVIVGLQEMVKLNAKSVIQGKDRERVMVWEKIISRSLCKKQKYVCIARKPMVGCFILLFTRDDHKNRINNIRTSKVKTGFGGQSGNKGSVAIRFNFDQSSFAFINCHLSSGQNEVSERFEDLREIYKRSFDCSQKYQDFMIQSHDYKFIFGDLNFRINLNYETVKSEIAKQNYAYLQSKDQLLQARMSNSILNRFLEGELNFDPTYKYDDHSNSYDTSQKRRIPAWCDRVLYEKSEKCRGNLELLAYGRKESFFSDHRPVYGIYRAEVCKVDSKQKEEIEKRLLEQLFGSKSNQSSTDFKAEGQNEASDNVAQVNQKFDLMKINIQDGYLDESNANGESTNALDDLLESIPQQTSSSAIDELLNSQHKSQSMHVLGNLISLSPEKNTGQVKSSEALDDLIDLGYVNQPTNQKHHPQYMHQPQFNLHQYQSNQSLPTNYNSQPQSTHNTTFNMQNNYFQFQSTQSSAFNLQQQQQQQPPPTQTDPSKLFDELFQNPIQQPVYQQQPNLGAFNRGLQSLQTQNNNGGKVHNAQNAQEILSQLFGEELLEKQPRQQKEEEEVRSFFQF